MGNGRQSGIERETGISIPVLTDALMVHKTGAVGKFDFLARFCEKCSDGNSVSG